MTECHYTPNFSPSNHVGRKSSDAFKETMKGLYSRETPMNYRPGRKSMLEYEDERKQIEGDTLSRPPQRLGRHRSDHRGQRHQACHRRAYHRACHHPHHQLRRTSS
jgi:hypothetical protein